MLERALQVKLMLAQIIELDTVALRLPLEEGLDLAEIFGVDHELLKEDGLLAVTPHIPPLPLALSRHDILDEAVARTERRPE